MKFGYKTFLYLIVLNILTPEIAEACQPQINWGSSVSFCQGNSFTLNAANPNSTYVWSTGASSPNISVSTSGTYWVSVTNPCGTTSDTIQVIVDTPVNVNLGADRAICNGSTLQLSVPFSPSHSYYWQNGFTGNQITVAQAGTYHVAVTNACGTYRDSITIAIDSPQNISLGQDIINCGVNPSVLTLQSGLTGTIKWSNGSSGNSLSVSNSGTYWVEVTNACGVVSDTVNVDFVGPGNLFNTDTILFCNSGSLTLNSPINSGGHLWSTSSTGYSIQVTQPGAYWLTVTLPCGTFSDTVHLIGSSSNMVNLGPDITFCSGDSVTLNVGNPGSIVLWKNGLTTQTIITDTAGTYWVGADNGCGMVYDTVVLVKTPIPNPGIPDTVYTCQGSLGMANAGFWGTQTSYLWSDNSTNQMNTGLVLGAHWVRVSNNCDTVTVNFFVKPVVPINLELGKDTTFCDGQIVLRSNVSPTGNQFLWSKGNNVTPNLTVTKAGSYWLQITNACGVFTDTIRVTILNQPSPIIKDTVYKCPGSSVLLSTNGHGNTTYNWSNGSNLPRTLATTAGMYWLSASNQCGSLNDTVYVVDKNLASFSLGKDTSFCSLASITINLVQPGIDSVIWKNGQRKTSIKLTNSGTYWATAYGACGVMTDTIVVDVKNRAQKMLKDTSFCSTSTVVLDVTQKNAVSYLWSTNDTTGSIAVIAVGWYYVDITSRCTTIRDSAYVDVVSPLVPIYLGKDTLYCAGQLILDPGNFPSATYKWSNGDTTKTLTVSSTGKYYVDITNSCNTVTDTINVTVTGAPYMALGNNVKFCGGSTLNLSAQNPGCTYLWSNGDSAQTLDITSAGQYWVTITNACGVITDSIDVIVENPLAHLSLGGDTAICKGDSILLETQIPGVFTKWKNGSNMPSIYVKQTGDYWVQVSNSCGNWEDTIHVEVIDIPYFSLGADTAICAVGGALTLNGPSNMLSYHWQDGSSGTSFTAAAAGKYWLTVQNDCFSFTDTIEVVEEYPISINLGPDTTLCYGESLVLDANMGQQKFKWSDNSSIPSKTVTESGSYWLSARNSCGVFSDTIRVIFDQPINTNTVDTTICDGDTAVFDLSELDRDFTWFDGSKQKVRSFDSEGDYSITLSNECGQFERIYRVNVTYCECPFFIPNAFTPNGDGTNDEFKVGHSCDLSEYTIQIFNRWGQMIYEGRDADQGWDGTFKGQEAADGIYTYRISYLWYVYEVDRVKEHTGTLTLMR